MKNIYTTPEILEEILRQTGLNAVNFCKQIDANRSFVRDIRIGNVQRFSEKMADKIKKQFPDFSKTWILTGVPPIYDDSTQNGTFNGNNTGIIVQHGDNSTYNNQSNIEELIKLIISQQQSINNLTEQNNLLTKILADKI